MRFAFERIHSISFVRPNIKVALRIAAIGTVTIHA